MHPLLLYPTCLLVLAASFGIGLLVLPGTSDRPQATIVLAAADAVPLADAPQAPAIAPVVPLAAVVPEPPAATPTPAPAAALLTPPEGTVTGRFSKPEPVAPAPLLARGTDAARAASEPDAATPAVKTAEPARNEPVRSEPMRRKQVRREPAAKPPATEALRTVRRFGDNLRDIPVSSYAADGTRRSVVIRPTSIQDVYYYQARQ